ncbi:MAG: hypothetical protein HYS04_10850, partial [Acidobacteria bacterium]|nr:hypothetical protein [Acidobacteriota bacterium]
MKSALFLLFAPVLLAGDAKQRESVVHRLPALSAVFPPGAEPGAKVRVELLGDYLDRAQAVVFVGRGMAGAGEGSVGAQTSEAPIRARIVESRFTRLILDLEIGVNAAFGEHYFRVVTPRGPSNIALFRVGDQPHVLEKEPNSTLEQAMPVRLPVTLNARLERDGDFDFFRFHAHAGETWVFDLRSARNGNSLDAGLMLLDENGKRVAHSEDVFIWDPFLVHRFDGGGTFYAVVQGTHRNNDPSFAYQLDIRRAAHLQTISPLSFVPAAAEATIYGAALLDGGAKLVFDTARIRGTITGAHGDRASAQLEVDAGLAPGAYRFWIAGKDGRSNAVTLLVADTPRAGDAQNLRPPASIAGVARYREPERFSFEAKAGETLVFEGRAQRYGSPADLILRIRNTSGKTVATNDDGNFPGVQFNKDPYLVHKFKEHGR